MKKLLTFILTSMLSVSAMAADKVYLLTAAGPGGTYEAINLTVASVLSDQYDTEVVYHKNCAAAYAWARNNPDKKSLITYSSWNYIMGEANPDKAKCTIDISPKTFTGFVGERYDYLCTFKGLRAVDYVSKPGKIGVYANPIAMGIVRNQVKDIGVDHKVIPYKGFKATVAAAKSGEVDYIIINSTSKVIAAGGKCIATAAPSSNTDAENDGLVHFDKFITNPALQHTRVQFGLSAFGIDGAEVKAALEKEFAKNNDSFKLVTNRLYTVTVDRDINTQINELKALSDSVSGSIK